MKINAKDVASGLMLAGIAIAGLWLNQDHTLGTARRMGPGYMPMLTFWLLLGLGGIIFLLGLFNGPEKLERWAMRELVLVLTALTVFGLILEWAGLFLTLAVTICISTLADNTHRWKGVVGLIIFLLALCWWVFIRELDIRIEIWPAFWRR
ncbi:tripartite tricarboxylate transporter TctB family protein [Falsiroseomonas sp.]|uniref:tripartite tricarboxylate transporter TctB family protein n=1 Tax=Falsiroseomonas sp. TaxID=2870721 RepID=UPI003F710940